MTTGWQVVLDHEGRVVVGRTDEIEGRYLVVPQPDGTLELRLVEQLDRDLPVEQGLPAEAPRGELDPDAAEMELARWGKRALGDLSPEERARAESAVRKALHLIEVRPDERPQPGAIPSSAPEAVNSATSAVDQAWRYWLVQNRDAHQLFTKKHVDSGRTASQPAAPAAPVPGPAAG